MLPSIALERIDEAQARGILALLPSSLSASEKQRLDGFNSESRRLRYAAGRWLARVLVAAARGIAPEAVALEIDAQGRSSVADDGRLGLSISHCGDWVACALADGPVGIDIELTQRPRGDLLALAAIVHSAAQCEELAVLQGAARLRRFYQLWTLKEAALKCQGGGLDFERMRAMDFVAVSAWDAAAEALSLEHVGPGLMLALCCSSAAIGREQQPVLPGGVQVLQRLGLSYRQS